MPDRKLTDNLSNNSPILSNGLSDNEIKKALECCATGGTDECQNCPYVEKYPYCDGDMEKDLIDLINRLQADCENYKQIAEHQQSVTMDRGFEIKRLKEKIESLQAENERLKSLFPTKYGVFTKRGKGLIFTESTEDYDSVIGEISAEAYKEFAVKLEKKSEYSGLVNADIVYKVHIDNLLKELVGDNR